MQEKIDDFASWSSISIGVLNLDSALRFWRDVMGFEVLAMRDAPDPGLASIWGINEADIARQALLSSSGLTDGRLHLVEFYDPDKPVREGANSYDRVPKNLDIYVEDLPTRVRQLRKLNVQFKTPDYSELTAPDGTVFREIHAAIHDQINLVLLEVVGQSLPFNDHGFCGVGPLVVTVKDAAKEAAFLEQQLGLQRLSENVFAGPEIEKMIGLPTGTKLNIMICGWPDRALGKLEIVEYDGVDGADLYPRAKPKSLGLLHLNYRIPIRHDDQGVDLSAVTSRRYGFHDTFLGAGDYLEFATPGGLRCVVCRHA